MSFDLLPINTQTSISRTFRSRVIAVASGKGGVGKTNISVNLGLSLAQRGLRVALLDADLGTANIDIVLGLQPRYHLHHVVTGQKSLADIIIEGPYGLRVIPGASGLPDLANLPEVQRDMLLRALLVLADNVDLLLIDTSAGVGHDVVQFILAASEMLLITTPEPTAITDAYALIKILSSYQMPVSIKLIVNQVRHHGEGEVIGRKLAAVAKQFLGRQIEMIGALPYDPHIVEAVKRQSPVLQCSSHSPAAIAINRLSEQLWSGQTKTDSITGVAHFFRRLMSLSPISLMATPESDF